MLNKITQKLGITENLKYGIHVGKLDFKERLSKLIDMRSKSAFPSLYDIFSPTAIIFKGKIYNDSFELRRRFHFGDINRLAVASGKILGDDKDLEIEISIKAFPKYSALVYIPFIIWFLFISNAIISSTDNFPAWGLLFMFLFLSILVTIVIVTGRISVRRLKQEIENEFRDYKKSE